VYSWKSLEQGGGSVRWSAFEREVPAVAQSGRDLFTQYGLGLGFLATVRRDGGPRLHPMCPIFAEGGLFAFIVPSPKRADLFRDGRYAMHSFPADEVDDEFVVTGTSRPVAGKDTWDALAAAYHASHAVPVHDEWTLFEFDVQTALLSRYRFRGEWPPTYTVWKAAR
jgi:hypothetical protein